MLCLAFSYPCLPCLPLSCVKPFFPSFYMFILCLSRSAAPAAHMASMFALEAPALTPLPGRAGSSRGLWGGCPPPSLFALLRCEKLPPVCVQRVRAQSWTAVKAWACYLCGVGDYCSEMVVCCVAAFKLDCCLPFD